LFLAESAIVGLAGSVAGVFCGLLVARGMAGFIGGLMENIYGMADRSGPLHVEPVLTMAALLIGVATSMAAGFLPSRNAARVDPVKALQKGRYQVLTEGENRLRRIIAGAFGVVSIACMLFGRSSWAFYAGYLLLVLSALLLTPSFSLYLSRMLRLPLKWLLPVEGALAADSLIQSPRRTSATVAALMLALSMVIGLGGMARASYDSIQEWLHSTLNPDLFVSASENLVLRTFHFPGSMEGELERIEGIREVEPVRSVRLMVRSKSALLIAIETRKVANSTPERHVVAGDYARMHRLAAEGRGVIVAENFARRQKIGMGGIVDIASPGGMLRLPVVGILRDYSDQQGTIFMDQAVYRRYWNDDTVDVFRIYLKPGASAEEVKRRILERFAGQRRLFVFFNDEVRKWVIRLTDQWFGMTYLQTTIAVLVAILGIVNTLTVSIADRRRELGVLRAVGGLRIQIRRTLWMEALAIGLIGLILGLGFGAINLLYQLIVLGRDFAGMSLDYEYPVTLTCVLVPVILIAAFGSALGPAESAVRGSLVEALEYE
jgi:putative ABC transport system permease protein